MRKKITIICLILTACSVGLLLQAGKAREKLWHETWNNHWSAGTQTLDAEMRESCSLDTLKLQAQLMGILGWITPSLLVLAIVIWPIGAAYCSFFNWHLQAIRQARKSA